MNIIVAKTIKEGKEYAKNILNDKRAMICSTHNSVRGHCFDPLDTVHVIHFDEKVWKALIPAIQGADVYLIDVKKVL